MTAINYATELQIASGHDNAAGLTLITSIVDSDSIPFNLPAPFRGLAQGMEDPTLSRQLATIDSKVRIWWFQGITVRQLYKLANDYLNSNSSAVTVRTLDFDGTFTNFNAYISLKQAWAEMMNSVTGNGIMTPGNYRANWLDNVPVAFNIVGEAS